MSPATLLAAWREGENESKVLESNIVSLLLENGVSRYIFPDDTFYRSDISAHACNLETTTTVALALIRALNLT